MVAFYNSHLNFYNNYINMVCRWFYVTFRRFVWKWPPRPSLISSVPFLISTIYLGHYAFFGIDAEENGKAKITETTATDKGWKTPADQSTGGGQDIIASQ